VLKRLSVKGRMYIINIAILLLFVTLVVFAVRNTSGVKALSIQKTREVMLEDQKAKIKVATHTAAIMVSEAIDGIKDKNDQIAIQALLRRNDSRHDHVDRHWCIHRQHYRLRAAHGL